MRIRELCSCLLQSGGRITTQQRKSSWSPLIGALVVFAAMSGAGYLLSPHLGDNPVLSPYWLTAGAQIGTASADPYGNPWPEQGGYLFGTGVLNADGPNVLTIENKTPEPYLLHLVHTSRRVPRVVRQVYLPANTAFAIQDLSDGRYSVRHAKPSTGEVVERAGSIVLESQSKDGSGYMPARMRLVLDASSQNHGAKSGHEQTGDTTDAK